MDPKLIMSVEEKRSFFKNYFKKKDEEEKEKLEQLAAQTTKINSKFKHLYRPILPK